MLLSIIQLVGITAFSFSDVIRFDEACVTSSCKTQLEACAQDRGSSGESSKSHCKKILFCVAGVQKRDAEDASHCFNGLSLPEASNELVALHNCIDLHQCAIEKDAIPSSFFQVSSDGYKKDDEITIPATNWKTKQQETKLLLDNLHAKLALSNEDLHKSMLRERAFLNKIDGIKQRAAANAETSRRSLQKSLESSAPESSLVQSQKQKKEKAAAKAKKSELCPTKMFQDVTKYSKWDERGIPTHDAQNQELSKNGRKKCVKEFDAQEILYNNRNSKLYFFITYIFSSIVKHIKLLNTLCNIYNS